MGSDAGVLVTRDAQRRTRVYLEVFDPFHLVLSHVKSILGLSVDASSIVSATVDKEGHTAHFGFRDDPWPSHAMGDTQAAVEFRDHWKEPSLFYAAEWLLSKSPSTIAPLTKDNGEVYLVLDGYQGIIPGELLKEVLRLGLRLEVLPNTPDR